MTFLEAVEHLSRLAPELAPVAGGTGERRKFELAHMRRLMHELGDPQARVPSVLIAGTNGKGSTAATLASILTAAGHRTGLYTSPHLVRVTERIQLAHAELPGEYGTTVAGGARPGADGALRLGEIGEEEFAAAYTQVDEAGQRLVESGDLPHGPSFFERLTAVAFLFFAAREAELMVLEVGLGGRLDATNVVEPLLSVLTDIALDHQEWLGSTIREITGEKCGILREGGVMVTLPQLPEANQEIGVRATALNVRAINAARYIPSPERLGGSEDFAAREPGASEGVAGGIHFHPRQGVPSTIVIEPATVGEVRLPGNRYTVSLEEGRLLHVDSPLAGQHQQRNLALAIAAAVELREDRNQIRYEISDQAIEEGIRKTRWPGRLESLAPNLLLDVAHNPAGAWTLRSVLSGLPEDTPRTLIFSCLRDKSLEEMSRILFPLFDSTGEPARRHDHVILAPIASPRAADVADLLAAAHALGVPAHAAPHLAAALAQARQITPAGGLIVATGSVYLVGEIRELLLAGSSSPGHAEGAGA